MTFDIFWPDETEYKITRWTADSIEAGYEPSPTEKPCRTTKLQLNFNAKEYFMITTNAHDQGCDVLGVKFDKLTKPRIAKIVDGEKIIQAERQAFRKRQFEMLASEYRRQITTAVEKANSASSTVKTQTQGSPN